MKKKICSRFRNTITQKIDFTGYGIHRDHPPRWKLINKIYLHPALSSEIEPLLPIFHHAFYGICDTAHTCSQRNRSYRLRVGYFIYEKFKI